MLMLKLCDEACGVQAEHFTETCWLFYLHVMQRIWNMATIFIQPYLVYE